MIYIYLLNAIVCKFWYQSANKYGSLKHLDANTPINSTFKKSKIEQTIVKNKISKNGLWHKLPTTQTNLYAKFHENPSQITLAYIAILVRTENRRKIFHCCFSLLGSETYPKKVRA